MRIIVRRQAQSGAQVQVPKPAQPQQTQTQVRTARRVGSAVVRDQERSKDRERILAALKSISEADAAIDRAQEAKDAALAQIEELMKLHKIPVIDDGRLLAEIAERYTRQSMTIDPKKFRNKVGAKDFWECIDVAVVKARRVLGEKELASISDVVPAKSTGFHLSVRELKRK